MPHTSPEPSQAAASTRRTGTPSIAVISRSLASARIAVPTLVDPQEHGRAGGDDDREDHADDLRPVHPHVADVVVPPRRRQRDARGRRGRQTHCITPSRISSRPSVAVALTSGSRAANGGPNTHAVEQRDGAAEDDARRVGDPLG